MIESDDYFKKGAINLQEPIHHDKWITCGFYSKYISMKPYEWSASRRIFYFGVQMDFLRLRIGDRLKIPEYDGNLVFLVASYEDITDYKGRLIPQERQEVKVLCHFFLERDYDLIINDLSEDKPKFVVTYAIQSIMDNRLHLGVENSLVLKDFMKINKYLKTYPISVAEDSATDPGSAHFDLIHQIEEPLIPEKIMSATSIQLTNLLQNVEEEDKRKKGRPIKSLLEMNVKANEATMQNGRKSIRAQQLALTKAIKDKENEEKEN